MGTLKVGIREFREKLASYLLETEETVAAPAAGARRRGDFVENFKRWRRGEQTSRRE